MINYSLKCADGHSFDSWFQSAAAFDKLAKAGLVTCSFCGSSNVEKAIMAPRIRTGRKAVSSVGEPEQPESNASDVAGQGASDSTTSGAAKSGAVSAGGLGASPGSDPAQGLGPSQGAGGPGVLSSPSSDMERALGELRRQVEKNSDYVGKDFASEARAMHLGDAPERAIHGEAKPEEAKALIEEGISVLPLPFGRNRKTN